MPERSQLQAQLYILNLIQKSIFLVAPDGQIRAANDQASTELGYSTQSLLQKTIFEINPHFSLLEWRKQWKKLQDGKPVEEKSELLSQNGVLFPVRTHARLLQLDGEEFCFYLIDNMLEDNRYKDMLEVAASVARVGGWEYDLVREQVLFTPEFNHLLQREAREERRTPFGAMRLLSRVLAPKDLSALLNNCREAIAKGAPFSWQPASSPEFNQMELHGEVQKSEGITSKLFGTLQLVTDPGQDASLELLDYLQHPALLLDPAGNAIHLNPPASRMAELQQGESLFSTLQWPESSRERLHWTWNRAEGYPHYQIKARRIPSVEAYRWLVEFFPGVVNQEEIEAARRKIDDLRYKLREEKAYLNEELAGRYDFNNIVTDSPDYKKVLQQAAQVAHTDATVLILGETGTGKELLARAIHHQSERKEQVLVRVNCAALPENLIESELFGHEKGAFTGAHKRKIGRFELAHQGTIFLDEIGELPLALQTKLLRVLQEGEFNRLGSNQTIEVDVRVIAATNRELEKLVNEGAFREDLYYRLNVFPLKIPALRERAEDIPLLIKHFVEKFCRETRRPAPRIPKKPVRILQTYGFPGNVRELENIVERALILSNDKKLNLHAVIDQLRNSDRQTRSKSFLPFEQMQKQHIIAALKKTKGKVTGSGGAAELLQINGKTLASKMRKLGIRRKDYLKSR